MTVVDVETPDGWRPGSLERWRRCDQRGWIGYVWWSEGPGLQHVEWITAERLRPSSAIASQPNPASPESTA